MQSPEAPPTTLSQFPTTMEDNKPQRLSPTNINNNNNNNNNLSPSNNMNIKDNVVEQLSSSHHTDSDNHHLESTNKLNGGIDLKKNNGLSLERPKDKEKATTSSSDEDEPDAMSTDTQNVDKLNNGEDDRRKQFNGYSDSGEEDMDEDDRLVIDDEDQRSSLSKTSTMDQVFSCPQCHVVTTSAKAYLYHLDNVHNVKESGKNLRLLASDEDDIVAASPDNNNKTLDSSSGGGFLNLSIPLHRDQSSSMLKEHEEYDDEDSGMNNSSFAMNTKGLGSVMTLGITTDNIDQIFDDDKKKKKKTRQEVDPGKYFEAVDSSGTKYACSQCGNIYKWRKSLNKHWKEKHLNDPLAEVASPPGMLELLKSGKYTQLGSRRIYDNNFLQTIKTQKDDDFSGTSTPNSELKSSTPTNFVDNSSDNALLTPIRPTLHPKMIGPFVANTVQPVFPGMGLALQHLGLHQNGYDSASDDGVLALDLTRAGKNLTNFMSERHNADPNSSFDQDQPLDFSKKGGMESNNNREEKVNKKIELDPFMSKVHRCSKCDYTSTSDVDFANHTGSHYSKRVCKCFECKIQLNSMEELNAHYVRDHNKKLTEYKEAIKKIPHGLQQTYHLLKMDLQSIGELNNQDLGSSESKSLKCKKCDFEAKWPAELQKHAVSHSEERPYICMVCGSTYKWKWDLVKHFQKSHPALPNPYRRNDKRETPDVSSEDEIEDEPEVKRSKLSASSSSEMMSSSSPLFNRDDGISVEGIIAATQAGQRFVSSQPNLLDGGETSIEDSIAFMQSYQHAAAAAAAAVASGAPVNLAQELVERHTKAQKAIQEAIKNRQNALNAVNSPGSSHDKSLSSSPGPLSGKAESLPYKCTMCNYHARWPSEVTQHMKNHSDCKPYLCPRCDYRSKWKWDVVKHLKRCGGGTINDVIDMTKVKKKESSPITSVISGGPPNAIVSGQGKLKKTTPQPLSFILPSVDANGQQSALVVRSSDPNSSHSHIVLSDSESASDLINHDRKANSKSPHSSEMMDLTMSSNNNNNGETADNNVNNNYAAYNDGHPILPATPSSLANPTSSSQQQNLLTPSSSSSSSLTSPTNTTTSNVSTNSSHRQNNSGEIWNCPHCPFSTQSQAELKRHSGLHMDDKPFKCDECHYSTRWACDLKKHRKSYDHHPKRNNNNTNLMSNNDNKTMPKTKNTVDDNAKKDNQGRFKCFECSVFFINLQRLIDHRKNSHSPSDRSSPPQTANAGEMDAARIKHPRKQIKQFSCPKCPFICKNRLIMDKHIDEHEQMDKDAFQCFYCNCQYKDKEGLLDHIISHPAFSAKEWETFFMITEEEEQSSSEEKADQMDTDDTRSIAPAENNNTPNKNDNQQSQVDSDAATQARIQQILDEIPKQKVATQQQQQQHQKTNHSPGSFNKFKCEWCPAEFINLTAVYKHASIAHPIQLKEQDVSMSLAYTGLQGKNSADSSQSNYSNNNKNDTGANSGEALQILKQQIAEKRNHQLAEKFSHMVTSNPKLQEVLNKRLEEDMSGGGKRFQCDKCTFSSSNQMTFQTHYELHLIKGSTQCWFCEYSVDKMELLYQHMKISHTRKWKALSQNPKYANQIQRMNLAFANTSVSQGLNSNDVNSILNSSPESTGVMDLSSKKSPSSSELGHDIVYIRKPQYTWSGIPVNVIPDGTVLNFVCPKCSFNDASIAKTCAHVMQSHRAMSKFNCTRCQFSDDNIHVMSDHCKTCHPVQERIVEVLDFKQLNFTELQMVQLSAMKEKFPQDLTKDSSPSDMVTNSIRENSPSPVKPLSCPFCPFKTSAKESMKQHIGNHSQNSRFRCQSCDFSSDSPVTIAQHVKVHEGSYEADGKVLKNMKIEKGIALTKEEPDMQSSGHKPMNMEMAPAVVLNEAVKAPSPKSKTPGRIRYRCSICPYHTTCKSNIFKHKRQHVIPKRYKCTKCSYTAARAVLLRKHIESHNIPIDNEDGYYHDIFYDPYDDTPNEKMDDTEEAGDLEEVEAEDVSEEDSTSDDLDSEMNTKAIADLEAKDILQAEAAAHKVSSSSTSFLMDETENADSKLRKQKCSHCPFSSNSSYEFRKHLNFHGTQERYKCDHCTYSIDRFNLLTQHRKLHSNDPGYSPNPVPSDLLNTSFILQQNEMNSCLEEDKEDPSCHDTESGSNPSQFCCTLCSYTVSNKNSLDIHYHSHGQRKRYICDYCDWSADRMPLLHQHRKVHQNEPSFKSNPAESIFLNQEFDDGASGEFEAKFMEIPDNDKQSKDGESELQNSPPFKLTVVKKSYPCKLCPFKTNSKNNYHIHKSMHSSDGEFSCSECSYSAISQGLLQQHQLLHSSNKSHASGNALGNDSTMNSSFSDTQLSSSSSLTCQRCPYIATSPASLSDHMKGHSSGQDKLVCPFCDFKATTVQVMYPHIQIHFPGTKLEPEAMAKMLEEHAGKNGGNNVKNRNKSNEAPVDLVHPSVSGASSTETTPAPSTPSESRSSSSSNAIKTKIYVCQYCEREFEAKSLMIQHEKQHLGGSH